MIEAGPHDPTQLAMRIDAFANEFRPSLKNEISLHSFPKEVEFIPAGPHVRASGADSIFVAHGVVRGRPGQLRGADIRVSVKLAQRTFLRQRQKNSASQKSGAKHGESEDRTETTTGDGKSAIGVTRKADGQRKAQKQAGSVRENAAGVPALQISRVTSRGPWGLTPFLRR